jgi:transglutaminase-like putative cysteine protease
MNTPPLLLGATLLFWGWQTGLLPFAGVMAVVLEGARFVRARWEFSQTDLDRLWNLCTLIFVGVALYALTTTEGAKAWVGLARQNTAGARADALHQGARSVLLFFQWLPFTFFLMAAAQAFNARSQMDLSTFSWWLRRRRKDPQARAPGGLNLGYPYFAVCLLAACAAKAQSPWFLAGLGALLGWALWRGRPRGCSPLAWAGSLVTALLLGFALQTGLVYLQAAIQRLDNLLTNRLWRGREFDADETRTRIGALGPVKLSGRIVLRLKSGDQSVPQRLRQASYDFFSSPIWAARTREFGTVFFENTNEQTWVLLTNQGLRHRVTIAGFLEGGKGVLALPLGAAVLEQLPVFGLQTNRLGAVRSTDGPGFVEFQARYTDGVAMDAPPGTNDLEVPSLEQPALDQVVRELKLAGRPPKEIVAAIARWFADHFEYAPWQEQRRRRDPNETPLSRFLLRERKGHCEYFATATALLLRHAGVPARYAVGYAVMERKGREWIVRERHGHAWCLAWVEGAWREVDTTPGSWVQTEADRSAFWEPLSDWWSKGWFAFSKFRWGQTEVRRYVVWLVVPPLLIVAARLVFSKQWRRARERARQAAAQKLLPGTDSEFYLVERQLAEGGLERRPGETLSAWLGRAQADGGDRLKALEPLLALHYRLRFDPGGVTPTERLALREQVQAWLRQSELTAAGPTSPKAGLKPTHAKR